MVHHLDMRQVTARPRSFSSSVRTETADRLSCLPLPLYHSLSLYHSVSSGLSSCAPLLASASCDVPGSHACATAHTVSLGEEDCRWHLNVSLTHALQGIPRPGHGTGHGRSAAGSGRRYTARGALSSPKRIHPAHALLMAAEFTQALAPRGAWPVHLCSPLLRQVHALAWPRLEQTAFYDAPFLLTTLHAVSAATRSFVLAGDGAFGFTFLASHVRSMMTCPLPASALGPLLSVHQVSHACGRLPSP